MLVTCTGRDRTSAAKALSSLVVVIIPRAFRDPIVDRVMTIIILPGILIVLLLDVST